MSPPGPFRLNNRERSTPANEPGDVRGGRTHEQPVHYESQRASEPASRREVNARRLGSLGVVVTLIASAAAMSSPTSAQAQPSALSGTTAAAPSTKPQVVAKPTQPPKSRLNEARYPMTRSTHAKHPGTPPSLSMSAAIAASKAVKKAKKQGFSAAAQPASTQQPAATQQPSNSGPQPSNSSGQSAGSGAQGATAAATASLPQPSYNGPDSCVDATKTVCAWDDIYHVHRVKITVTMPQVDVTVETKRLLPWPGQNNAPDTLVYALRCDNAACSQGEIMGINDDGGLGYASKLTFSPTAAGEYWLVVIAYDTASMGIADVVYSYDNLTNVIDAGVYFGGYQVRSKEVRKNDSLFVGKNTNDSQTHGLAGYPEYHDTTLFFLGNDGDNCAANSGCGNFYFNDDVWWGSDYTRLSRIEFPNNMAPTVGRALVSVWNAGDCTTECNAQAPHPYKTNGRLFHYRRHLNDQGDWSGAAYEDQDQDGLSLQIEDQIGTCDSIGGFPSAGMVVKGFGCRDYRKYVNDNAALFGDPCGAAETCWSAADSDNDGIRDDMEVWAAAFDCAHQPQPPKNEAGTCTPIGLHDLGGCSGWCVAEGISAVMDPNPAVYDTYVRSDYWDCENSPTAGDPNRCLSTHSNWSGTDYNHKVYDSGGANNNDQVSVLKQLWTDSPGTCWDGTDPSGACKDTQGNDLDLWSADRRLYSQMHVWGDARRVEDDAAGVELAYGGVRMVVPYYLQFHDDVWRHGHLGRYALATHIAGGQAWTAAPVFVWGNPRPDASYASISAITSTFSHEAGHTLTLRHPHHGFYNGYCSSPCPTTVAGCMACEDSRHTTPVRATVMSYDYGIWGMRAKSPTAPSFNAQTDTSGDGCTRREQRFSKGSYMTMAEASTNETLGHADNGAPPTWQQIITVQTLGCYDHPTDQPCYAVPSFDFKTSQTGLRQTPYCDSTGCYINWDKDNGASLSYVNPVTYQENLDNSRAGGGTNQCKVDVLTDLDEWGRMVAVGKNNLDPNWDFTRWFAIYVDGFNAETPSNYAKWPIPVSSTAGYGRDVYPINACKVSADCGPLPGSGQVCRYDGCAVDSDCESSNCNAQGVCTCAVAAECRSGRCNLAGGGAGVCETGWGGCSCAGTTECFANSPGPSSCLAVGNQQVCRASHEADYSSSSDQPYAAHVSFDGSGVMQLAHTGPDSALTTINDNDQLLFGLDFRFDGFGSGQSSQVLASSDAFILDLYDDSGTTRLRARIVGGPTLTWTPSSPWTPRTWWRVRVGYVAGSGGAFYLVVSPWRLAQGGYEPRSSSPCVRSSATLPSLANVGNVLLGGEPSSSSTRLHGGMDNVYLKNTIEVAVSSLVPALSTCAVQP